jgi:hypothetical protein
MKHSICINQNDYGITLKFVCRDEAGRPIDLSGFSVDFYIYDGGEAINAGHTACAIVDAPMGEAQYEIAAQDAQTPGLYQGKLRLSHATAEVKNLGVIPFCVQAVY